MADSDKIITITPATSTSNEPSINFTGGDNNPITLKVIDDGTLSFEASEGQVFSVSESLSGEIFSVSDISGIPLILAKDNGDLQLNPHAGNVLVGTQDDNLTDKMQIQGGVTIFGDVGQLFSVNDDDSEDLFSVNDISGVPSIRVKENGDVLLAEYTGVVQVGLTNSTVPRGMEIRGGLKINHAESIPNDASGNDYTVWISRYDGRDWALMVSGETLNVNDGRAPDYGLRVQTNSSASYAIAVDVSGSYKFRVNGAGDALATSHGAISDQRLKENVTNITGSIDLIKSLRGVNFTWIDNPDAGNQIGFIAQEVEEHVPEIVINDAEEESVMPDGSIQTHYKHVEYGKLVPVLVEAIKEQQAMIEALQVRLDAAGL
jgi:hypothetical protein